MTSLGKSCLSYMVTLKPALEARGYEVAVFHTTGMGGRAFESLAAPGAFCAVMDFSLQELANHLGGSVVTSGADRLTGAGRSGTPQLVAPGAVDMVDFPAWQPVPASLAGRDGARAQPADRLGHLGRRRCAARIAPRSASGWPARRPPPACCCRRQGVEQWDRPGEPLHDPEGLDAFIDRDARRGAAPTCAARAGRPHQRRRVLRRRAAVLRRLGGARVVPAGVPTTGHGTPGPRDPRASEPAQALVLDFGGVDQPHAVRNACPDRSGAGPAGRHADLARPLRPRQRRAVAAHAGRRDQRARLLAGPHARGRPRCWARPGTAWRPWCSARAVPTPAWWCAPKRWR
jgi:hypothetical protein